MKIFISYPFGNTELEASQRNKKIFSIGMQEGFNSRKIIETCLSHKDPLKFLPYIERIEQSSHNHYSVCFCMLIEEASGLVVDKKVQAIRTILLELERIYSHSIYLKRLFEHADNQVIINHLVEVHDSIVDCFEEICGHRMFGTGHVFGDTNFNISTGNLKLISGVIAGTTLRIKKIRKLSLKNISLRSLFSNKVIISEKEITTKELTGPFSWHKDINDDMRRKKPYLSYKEDKARDVMATPLHTNIDAEDINCMLSRMWRIIDDIDRSAMLINTLIATDEPVHQRNNELAAPSLKSGAYSNSIEAPRGIISMSIEVNKDQEISSMNIVSPSDINKRAARRSLDGTELNFIGPAFESLYISMMEIDK